MTKKRIDPQHYHRLSNAHIRKGILNRMEEVALYALIGDLLSWMDRSPDNCPCKGSFKEWVYGYCKDGRKRFNRIWKRLQELGLLKMVSAPQHHNNFNYFYELRERPDMKTPVIQNMTAVQGRKYLAARQKPVQPDKAYTKVSVSMLLDRRLTLHEKGLFILIQSEVCLECNGAGTEVLKSRLLKKCTEGETSFDRAWKGLKAKGYLEQTREMEAATGRFQWHYTLHPSPCRDCKESESIAVKKRTVADISDNTRPASPAKTVEERAAVKAQIKQNVRYDELAAEVDSSVYTLRELDEYIQLMTEVVCSSAPTVRISSETVPAEHAATRMLEIDKLQMAAVMESVAAQRGGIINLRGYRLKSLYCINECFSGYLQRCLA